MPVPLFSKAQLDHANYCAQLLWDGISYSTGKRICGDRELLTYFYGQVSDFVSGRAQNISFDRNYLHQLVVVCDLKPVFRQAHTIYYNELEHFLEINILRHCRSAPYTTYGYDLSTFTKEAGKALRNTQPHLKPGYHITLASRILYFAMPMEHLYNFSDQIRRKLFLQSRPQAAISNYYEQLDKGYMLNSMALSSYRAPAAGLHTTHDAIGSNALQSWWERRVYDLALLFW